MFRFLCLGLTWIVCLNCYRLPYWILLAIIYLILGYLDGLLFLIFSLHGGATCAMAWLKHTYISWTFQNMRVWLFFFWLTL
jgi:hypothetical protein